MVVEERAPALRVFLLGSFRVAVEGRALPDDAWRRRKARQLFKCLVSRPRRLLTKDEAIELLWPDSDPDAAAVNLRSTVHSLRQTLRPLTRDPANDLVVVTRETVGLRPDADIWVDADAFEHAVARAQRAADPTELLAEASALYAGDYLPEDLYEEWATERRDELKRAWFELRLAVARRHDQLGDPEAAIGVLLGLRDADPCDERAAQELIGVYARQGRRAEAMRAFQRLAAALRDELGVEPSPESVELHRRVAAGEALEPTDRPPSGAEPAAAFLPSYPFPAPGRLVGRTAELDALARVVELGRSAGQTVLIGGSAGAGKSTLAGWVVEQARGAGVLCLAGGSHEQSADAPLGPFADALADYLLDQPAERVRELLGGAAADLARVVPELRYRLELPDAPTLDPQPERLRLFGAVHACLRRLAERGPVLLCLEDLHAADAPSLDLLHYLARQTRRLPLVLVGTFRADEALPGRPFARLRDALARERLASVVALAPLERRASDLVVAAVLGGPIDEPLGTALFAATEGNPLFLEQLALALREQGRVAARAGRWEQVGALDAVVPPAIREVIGQRLERLSARCRATLETAAVLGPSVAHGTLLATVGAEDEAILLADLDEALGAQLLYETGSAYAFRHALVREAVYWSLSTPRRMLLHARAGETIERLVGERAEDEAAQLAYHFARAGQAPSVRARALRWSLAAGRHAAALSSHREALGHFTRACELVEAEGERADPGVRLEAIEGRGNAELQMAMWGPAIASFRRVLELSNDLVRRGATRGAVAHALTALGEIDAAAAEIDTGLAELPGVGDGREVLATRLQLQNRQILPRFLRGRFGDLVALGEEMRTLADDLGEPPGYYWAHSVTAAGYMGQGHVESALEQYELVRAAAESAGRKDWLAIAHVNLGMQHYFGGELGPGRHHLEQSIALFRELANDLRAINSLQCLGRLALAEGDPARARDLAGHVLDLATEGGDRLAADGHDLLGLVQSLAGEWDDAAASFERALTIRRRVVFAGGIVESLLGLGLVHERRGDPSRARALYEEALDVAVTMDPCPQLVAARRHLGRLLLQIGEPGAAGQIEEAFRLAETMPRTLEYAATRLAMAELSLTCGDLAAAHDHAAAALAAARPVELRVEILCLLSDVELAAGRAEDAQARAAEAVEAAARLGAPRPLALAGGARDRAVASLKLGGGSALVADHQVRGP